VRAPQLRPTIPSALTVSRAPTRTFSVCLQCQFRRQPGLYSSTDEKKDSANAQNAAAALKDAANAREEAPIPGDVGGSRATLSPTDIPAEQPETEKLLYNDPTGENSVHGEGTQSGGLPSYLEGRRSQISKQFSTMMDNLQSNIFVAGQRLNDLTGYSGIEALKNEIQFQGTPHPFRRPHQPLITNN
jgi:sensitive to high expression protein 9